MLRLDKIGWLLEERLSVQKSALAAAGRDKLALSSSSSLLCQLTLDLHCPIFTPMCRWVGQPGKLFNLPPKCWKLGQDCYPFFLKNAGRLDKMASRPALLINSGRWDKVHMSNLPPRCKKSGQAGKLSRLSLQWWNIGQGIVDQSSSISWICGQPCNCPRFQYFGGTLDKILV